MIIAIYVTTQINSISAVWAFIIECGAGLGLVMILRWYWWRINAWSEITATIAPFLAYALSKYVFIKFDPSWGLGIGENPKSFFFTVGLTTVSWLVATYLSTTDRSVLESFFSKIKPDGNWRPFTPSWNGQKLGLLFICWLSAIFMAYSILFLTGSLILHEFGDSLLYVLVAIASFFILRFSSDKVNIFKD